MSLTWNLSVQTQSGRKSTPFAIKVTLHITNS